MPIVLICGLVWYIKCTIEVNMRLSQNFSLYEFLRSQVAARLGIDMTPGDGVIENLTELCNVILQPLRSKVGRLDITSGYRPERLNKEVGGSDDSGHIRGEAVDITSIKLSPKELFKKIYDELPAYDQLILEYDSWVHVSRNPNGKNRGEALIATKGKRGKVVYSVYSGGEL